VSKIGWGVVVLLACVPEDANAATACEEEEEEEELDLG
tara:strand:- start:352 stop:465 length:114 start_codon:yes stop_codon:yes gene_type:complete